MHGHHEESGPQDRQRLQAVRRVFMVTLALNLLVSLSELAVGYSSHTLSLVADGFHSLLDAASNVVGILALGMATQPADPDHPYGHRKFEAMAAMLISFFIFMTSFNVASEAMQRMMHPGLHPEIGWLNYAVKFGGLLVNLVVVTYETRRGRELNNALLLTDARHTWSDILVSVSVMVSMLAVQMGLAWMDTAMALVITVVIFRVGYDIIRTHLGVLVDEAVLDPEDVCRVVLQVTGVRGCHKVRSRGLRDHVFLDLHVQVDPDMTVKAAHQVSYRVEAALMEAFAGTVTDVLVHIEEDENPALEG